MALRVRYYCNLQPTGYGMSAVEYALALLRHADVELDIRPVGWQPDLGEASQYGPRAKDLVRALHRSDAKPPDVVLVHTLPRDCAKVLEMEGISRDIPAIAYTTWEATSMPKALAEPLKVFERILTPSLMSANSILMAIPEADVRVLHHCYDREMISTFMGGLVDAKIRDDRFAFYYIGAVNRRKNVEGLIRAFAHAFGGDPTYRLFLQCASVKAEEIPVMIAGTGFDTLPVEVDGRFISAFDLWMTHAASDCYVTASRGEAWGLGSFEAGLAGRHVIAPLGQGSDEYLEGTHAFRYRSTMQPCGMNVNATVEGNMLRAVRAGPTLLTSRETWWEPDLLELSRCMQAAADKRIRDLALYRPDHWDRFTHEAIAKQLVSHLEGAANARVH